MAAYGIPGWRKAPFLRIFPALATGVLLQWHTGPDEKLWWWLMLPCSCTILVSFVLPWFSLFKYPQIHGIAITILFISTGALLVSKNDIRNNPQWYGRDTQSITAMQVLLNQSPSEKPNSWKSVGRVQAVYQNNRWQSSQGQLLIYFRKDSLPPPPIGTIITIMAHPQPIINSGNPGSFDYKRYCLFHGITHQVYLTPENFVADSCQHLTALQKLVERTRDFVLKQIRKYINTEPALGLAEALLVGYKDDLDKNLVQSYTNTGVVHIIAISGLHLGLIYWLLQLICQPLYKKKKTRWLAPLIVLCGLWIFSLVAGAQASVLRSALMFSCLVLGNWMGRKSSMLNSLALSATILVCVDPFCLWDPGFQLSYAAVLSLILFMRRVYHIFYFPNKITDYIWQLAAVSIAAQILTTPVSLYIFHQFPVWFLITNIVAVPLSSIIVLGEIVLLVVSFSSTISMFTGKWLIHLIEWMNGWIRQVEALPFSLWTGILISIPQMILLYAIIFQIRLAVDQKSAWMIKTALACTCLFFILRSFSFIEKQKQETLLIYSIPKKTVMELISGRTANFYGDSSLLDDPAMQNFNFRPAHTFYRIRKLKVQDSLSGLEQIHFAGKKIFHFAGFVPDSLPAQTDFCIISGNTRFRPIAFTQKPAWLITDPTVPFKTTDYWKKWADSLQIPFHSVSRNGAFVVNLN